MSYVPLEDSPQLRLGKNYVLKEHVKNYPENIPCKPTLARYSLAFLEDWIEGEAEIDMECKEGNMHLEGRHFQILEFTVNGDKDYVYDGSRIFFKVVDGENRVGIRYRANFTGAFRKINMGHSEIASTGETENPMYWIPSLSVPGVKVRSELHIKVKKPLQAVSNGDLVSMREDGEWREYHYRIDFPHSFYLTSVAVGEFSVVEERVDDITLRYFLPKGKEEYSWNLSPTMDAMKFFSSYTGVKYPFSQYTQVVLFSMGGGMEYITSTHLTWKVLHEKSVEPDYTSDSLVSHELAHQWFGDMVTTKDWSNIWLNEAFATYFQALFTRYKRGENEFVYDLYSKLRTYLEEYSKYSRPIVTRFYRWPDELFDRHTYQKGALVLHTLMNLVGEETFREGIRRYLEKFAGKAVDTEDFRKIMEEVSGMDLTEFFDKYVYSAGHPEVLVRSDGTTVILDQNQEGIIYPLKVEVKLVTGGEFKKLQVDLKKRVELSLPKGGYLCVDPGFKTFAVIKDEQSEESLIAESKDEEIMCRIRAAWGLVKFNSSRSIAALSSLLRDPFWGVSYEAALALGKVGTKEALKELVSYSHPDPRARKGVANALGEFKFSEESGETLADILEREVSQYVRAEAIKSLGKVGIQKYLDVIMKQYKEESHVDVIRGAVIEALSSLGGEGNFKFILDKAFHGESVPVRESATKSLGKFGESAVDALGTLAKDQFPSVRQAAVEGLGETRSQRAVPILERIVNNEDEDGRIRGYALRKLYQLRGREA